MINTNSNDIIRDGVKLKDYLKDAIDEISDDYIKVNHNDSINCIEFLEYIQKYRNILLCINEICKSRKKY